MDDFFPTVLDLTGLANPQPEQKRDGQSLLPLLGGRSFERQRPLFWHYPHQWHGDVGVGLGIEPFSAMRKGRYKIIYFYGDGVADGGGDEPRVELNYMSLYVSEERDIAASQPRRCIKLRDELVAWLLEVHAGIPIVKSTDEPAVLPERGSPLRD
jgi:hypothetical protein